MDILAEVDDAIGASSNDCVDGELVVVDSLVGLELEEVLDVHFR